MKKTILSITAIAFIAVALMTTACKKKKVENPDPGPEVELITTIRLDVKGDSSVQTFNYKVENGFGSATGGTISVDTIKLVPGKKYEVTVSVLNEKKTPVEDITSEVIDEKDEHLFIYESAPVSGAGAISFSDGDKDNSGKPFNRFIRFTTGTAGSGKLTVTLKHEPTDKSAATASAAGGETDAEAVFPVVVK